MRLRSALLAATILAAPATALAQPIEGLYVGVGAGFNFLSDQAVNNVAVPNPVLPNRALTFSTGSLNLRTNDGWVGLGSLGWGFGNGLRVEGEFSYRHNQERELYTTPSPTDTGGDTQTYGAMANVLYDFDLAPFGVPMLPYVGVGVGYAWQQLDGLRISSWPNPANYYARFSQTEGGFAAQGIVGLSFPIPAIPGLAITAEYRPFAKITNNTYSGYYQHPVTTDGKTTLVTTATNVKLGSEA